MPQHLSETLHVDDRGWRLVETGWDADHSVAVASNFLVGNGYLGYRGTTPEQRAADYVALVVTDTYDCADGHWRELTTAPNPLYVAFEVDGEAISVRHAHEVATSLDLRHGFFSSRFDHQVGASVIRVETERFASYEQLHTLVQRVTFRSTSAVRVKVAAGVDGDIWSLNGQHLPVLETGEDDRLLTAAGRTVESRIDVAVAAEVRLSGGENVGEEPIHSSRQSLRIYEVDLAAGGVLLVETFAAVGSSSDFDEPRARVAQIARSAAAAGYAQLREATSDRWDQIWDTTDVVIDGSPVDQAGLRFAAYHNRVSTPAHTTHLPIGARGLSCQAYQGAAFWDQEIYNLPVFLFTEPEIARSILIYRHRTLDGARRKASRLGYDGAYYAWISGLTGDELCPDIFFEDVLTGRPIRNHFNVWQMHIAPDIVTTVARYVDVTGDEHYLVEYGAEIAFEVARFLRSFVRYDEWRRVYHCIRLLGPDEWHENVDDNAFTNYQVRAALDFAIETHERLARDYPEQLEELASRLSLQPDEIEDWRRIRDRILLPQPDPESRLIEQFEGFFQLEDVSPDEVRTRLLDPNEYWGWPNGVAVATQVSKQADVVMLLWQHPDLFDDGVARANYEYYEPRCSHNSSLSHAAHGFVAGRIGELDVAHRHFRETAIVDMLNVNHPVVAGTFIGGIHTAACGGTYQLAVHGFGGLGYRNGFLTIDPKLPTAWTSIKYPISWRDRQLRVEVYHDRVEITAAAENPEPVLLRVREHIVELAPGTLSVF